MADENKLQALRISPGFLDNLQKERNLSHEAFLVIAQTKPIAISRLKRYVFFYFRSEEPPLSTKEKKLV